MSANYQPQTPPTTPLGGKRKRVLGLTDDPPIDTPTDEPQFNWTPEPAEAPKASLSLLDRIREATGAQESGNNFNVHPNGRTGALGQWQVLPGNVPAWTQKHLGRSLTPEQFAKDPDAQIRVFNGEFGSYLNKALASGADEDTAIRMAGAGWYGGPGRMNQYDNPKRFRPKEPSYREYTMKLLNGVRTRIPKVEAPVTETPEPGADEDAPELSAAAIRHYKTIGRPDLLTPTNPTEVADGQFSWTPEVDPTPVPEQSETLEAQIASMDDPNSPRAAVLITPGEQPKTPPNGVRVRVPEGLLIINTDKSKKLGLGDEEQYVAKNGFAGLLGKVEDVGSATSDGHAVVARGPDGAELDASIVTTPQAAQAQAQVNQQMHPGSVQTVEPAQQVVQRRRPRSQQHVAAPASALPHVQYWLGISPDQFRQMSPDQQRSAARVALNLHAVDLDRTKNKQPLQPHPTAEQQAGYRANAGIRPSVSAPGRVGATPATPSIAPGAADAAGDIRALLYGDTRAGLSGEQSLQLRQLDRAQRDIRARGPSPRPVSSTSRAGTISSADAQAMGLPQRPQPVQPLGRGVEYAPTFRDFENQRRRIKGQPTLEEQDENGSLSNRVDQFLTSLEGGSDSATGVVRRGVASGVQGGVAGINNSLANVLSGFGATGHITDNPGVADYVRGLAEEGHRDASERTAADVAKHPILSSVAQGTGSAVPTLVSYSLFKSAIASTFGEAAATPEAVMSTMSVVEHADKPVRDQIVNLLFSYGGGKVFGKVEPLGKMKSVGALGAYGGAESAVRSVLDDAMNGRTPDLKKAGAQAIPGAINMGALGLAGGKPETEARPGERPAEGAIAPLPVRQEPATRESALTDQNLAGRIERIQKMPRAQQTEARQAELSRLVTEQQRRQSVTEAPPDVVEPTPEVLPEVAPKTEPITDGPFEWKPEIVPESPRTAAEVEPTAPIAAKPVEAKPEAALPADEPVTVAKKDTSGDVTIPREPVTEPVTPKLVEPEPVHHSLEQNRAETGQFEPGKKVEPVDDASRPAAGPVPTEKQIAEATERVKKRRKTPVGIRQHGETMRQAGMTEAPDVEYDVQSVPGWKKDAAATVREMGLEGAIKHFKNMTDSDQGGRQSLGNELLKHHITPGTPEYHDVARHLIEHVGEAGQTMRAAQEIGNLDPENAVAYMEMASQRQRKRGLTSDEAAGIQKRADRQITLNADVVKLDKQLDAIARKPRFGKNGTLSQFIRSVGGIRVDKDRVNRGELSGLTNKEAGTTGLITKDGMTAEDAARHAYESGYLRDIPDILEDADYGHVDVNKFLEAMHEDAGGIRSHRHVDELDNYAPDVKAEELHALNQGQRAEWDKRAQFLDDPEVEDLVHKLEANKSDENAIAEMYVIGREHGLSDDAIKKTIDYVTTEREDTSWLAENAPGGRKTNERQTSEAKPESGAFDRPYSERDPEGYRREQEALNKGKAKKSTSRRGDAPKKATYEVKIRTQGEAALEALRAKLKAGKLELGTAPKVGERGAIRLRIGEIPELKRATRTTPLEPWQMSQKEYIAAINPGNKRLEPSDRPTVFSDDLEGMAEGKTIARPQLNSGETVQILKDEDGTYYAKIGKQTVGYISQLSNGDVDMTVAKDFQRKGIGRILNAAFRKDNPLILSGGLTEAGERTVVQTHAQFVRQALAEGKPVPAEVLAAYPDLARAPKLDLGPKPRPGERGAVRVEVGEIPELKGDAELIAQYAASRLPKLESIDALNTELRKEFGAEIEPHLKDIRQRAYSIRAEARRAEIAASDKPRQQTLISEIRQELQAAHREVKAAENAELVAKREDAQAERTANAQGQYEKDVAKRADILKAKADTRKAKAEALRQKRDLATAAREQKAQLQRELNEARKAEVKGYRERIGAERTARKAAGRWDAALRQVATEARDRLPETVDPKDPAQMEDLVSVGTEKFLNDSSLPTITAISPARFYKEMAAGYPNLKMREIGKVYRRSLENARDATKAAREVAQLRGATTESRKRWEKFWEGSGIDGEDISAQALLIQRANKAKELLALRQEQQQELNRLSRSKAETIWDDYLHGATKSLRSTIDSMLLRQGFQNTILHPIITAKNALPGTRGYIMSKGDFQRAVTAMENHPRRDIAEAMGVDLPAVEEQYNQTIVSKLPHVRLSEQAATLQMTGQRLGMVDYFARMGEKAGYTPETNPEFYKQAGRIINLGTGRGDFVDSPTKARIASYLNKILWSGKLATSRFQLINDVVNPVSWIRNDPAIRKYKAMQMLKLGAMTMSTYAIANALGISVGMNPFEKDFGKARIGNTRYDLTGGEGSAIRLIAGLTAMTAYKTAGFAPELQKWIGAHFGTPHFGSGVGTEMERQLRYKLGPIPSLIVDSTYGEQKNAVGEDIQYIPDPSDPIATAQHNAFLNLVTPMVTTDFIDAAVDEESPMGLLLPLPALGGMGVQTYKDKPKKSTAKKSDPGEAVHVPGH